MLLLFWVLLFAVGAALILLMPGILAQQIYKKYQGARVVNCPETHTPVSVRFNAFRAATTALSGPPKLRLATCSRWPVRADCGQECIPDALLVPAEKKAVPPLQDAFPHLPALIAAAAAWVLGMVWHSEYVFRAKWMAALNLTDRQTRDLAEMWTPHLMTAAACILFAYGVTRLTLWLGRRTILSGLGVALSLWALVAAVFTIATHSQQLIWIEVGYAFLGALLVGAIVGAVPRRVFLKDAD